MNPFRTLTKSNRAKAVCYLFVVAVLVSGCTAGRVNLELKDVTVKPWSSPVPITPVLH